MNNNRQMKKLPIGLQTFRKLIEDDYVYVDKTRHILELIRSGTYFFLARPRRFGKSLLISTLKELFSGQRELFEGLYIHDKIEWKRHPVIHLDCSMLPCDNDERLKRGLQYFTEQLAAEHQLSLNTHEYDLAFGELIAKLVEKYQEKVVVLIDEYDKPILDALDHPDAAQKNRDALRNFYSMLKGNDQYLHFVFLTGVSKFSKVSIFSGLNNLQDITISPHFSALLGYTQEELETCFAPHLEATCQAKRMARADLLSLLKIWYNGYSWGGDQAVYNPFSILNFLSDMEFRNYWFATGTPTFLVKRIRAQQIDIAEFERQMSGEQSFDSYDLQHLDLLPLLFQTGYLTIKAVRPARLGGKSYVLSYPNFEVQESLLTYLFADFSGKSVSKIQPLHEQLFEQLNAHDLAAFMQTMQALFSSIPYPLHLPEEAYYHSLFYMILKLVGAEVSAEVATDRGRVDAVLECDDRLYVIECKYGEPGRTVESLTQTAIRQIRDKRYYEPFLAKGKPLVLLGIGVVEKTLGYREEALECKITPND